MEKRVKLLLFCSLASFVAATFASLEDINVLPPSLDAPHVQPVLPAGGVKIPNLIPHQDPLLETKGGYFGLNIPFLFQWQSQLYNGFGDMSSSLFRVKLLNGLLLDLDHNRVRDPITKTLVGSFTIKAFGMKMYDYADRLLGGDGWFAKRPEFSLPAGQQQFAAMQANANQFFQTTQGQLNQFANSIPSQMQAAFQHRP